MESITIQVNTAEDLSNLVFMNGKGDIFRLIKEEKVPIEPPPVDEFICQTQLRKLRGIGTGRIRKMEERGLKRHPSGNRVYYKLDEVNQYFFDK